MKNILLAYLAIIAFFISLPLIYPISAIYYFLNNNISNYHKKIAIGIDQAAAALLGWNEDMTISGHIGYRIQTGKATKIEKIICKILRFFEAHHCIKSIEKDEI